MTTMKAEQKDGLAQDKGDSCAAGTLKKLIIPHDAAYLVSHALTNLQKDNINPTPPHAYNCYPGFVESGFKVKKRRTYR